MREIINELRSSLINEDFDVYEDKVKVIEIEIA